MSDDPTYEFTLRLSVYDKRLLMKRALRQALAEGLSAHDYRAMRREGDYSRADIVMLLDPGSIPGCNIQDSTAEVLWS